MRYDNDLDWLAKDFERVVREGARVSSSCAAALGVLAPDLDAAPGPVCSLAVYDDSYAILMAFFLLGLADGGADGGVAGTRD